ncbi:Spc7-like protein [Dinothrombium tinctorium]|uniref:Spc7-like protein n=1 Tax=Dinothrombium tinctorium TaxID=1965070 RepID=A0A3S4R5A4_9ACAR|nr:Spc7-like protein [Dinothrombium tinctorium]RWS11771.1 Spc7-like protein [Dinothrombium tinctorium]
MATSSRILSSRAGRPMSSAVPMTASRPITSTGLVAPKTSRGRSALRRQVQDKSYWLGVLRAKMNELKSEITRLSKECENMRREESQIGAMQRKAETLAKELNNLSHELAVYNEFTDRMRSGESVDDVNEDINSLIAENEELSSRLEIAFEEKKKKEALVKNYEAEIKRIVSSWNNMRRLFSVEELENFESLEKENKELSAECDRLEREIIVWKEKKRKLEAINESSSDNFLRRELLQALVKLRSLEKQRNDLLNETNTEDERGRLLAQIKRDNHEIVKMEARIDELKSQMVNIKDEIEAFDDMDAIEKYKELKKKEETIEEFFSAFEVQKEEEIRKLRFYGESVNELLAKISKFLAHIEALNATSGGEGDTKANILDEKRKLELDLNKIEQLESKITTELDSLQKKIKQLETDIETYTDIPKLKEEMESKAKELENEKNDFSGRKLKAKRDHEELSKKCDHLKSSLEENNIVSKMHALEEKLQKILSSKEALRAEINAYDNTFLKGQVMDSIKKYNEKLLGF